MPSNKKRGDSGEQDVIDKVKCPNCSKKLQKLPQNYPLFDIQCTGCSFRAQVKTNRSSPKDEIFGAGWDIMHKVLKSGYMVPPLIANFCWMEKGRKKQVILFYPFVARNNLVHRRLSKTARRANYAMFNYVGLLTMPSKILYSSEKHSKLLKFKP